MIKKQCPDNNDKNYENNNDVFLLKHSYLQNERK